MKLSTRSKYGLRAVVELAARPYGETLSIKTIAGFAGVSELYLEQLFAPLKKAGIIEATRGAKGGYRLSKEAAEITVGDVLRALEGGLAPVKCLDDSDASCGNAACENCVTKGVWEAIYTGINDVVDSIGLAQLAQDYKLKTQNGGL